MCNFGEFRVTTCKQIVDKKDFSINKRIVYIECIVNVIVDRAV